MGLRNIENKGLNLVSTSVPASYEFGFENEHPTVSPPFTMSVFGQRFEGRRLSLTTVHLAAEDEVILIAGSNHTVTIQFEFQNFSVSIYPEVIVVGEKNGELILKFADPSGDHAAQLRFVLNSFIAGDFVTLGSVMSYSGPTKPKEEKAAVEKNWKERYRSIGVFLASAALAVVAASALFTRYTTSYEMHPVLIERAGHSMQATTAGQVAYLNPEATKGEILFSVNANSGDVLNFQMPCDCKAVLAQGVREGITVLPSDVILTILVNNFDLSIETLMSVEGLARAMSGDHVYLDLADGRSIPVQVIAGQAANTAALSGELLVPVRLEAPEGALSETDIGKFAQLRLTKSFF
ncbi:hypothetical protein [Aliiroseovarius sp. YM-037]|uniref:hypothetical protein n=1 Tax=Aliiroseovarius sp. YM-037 TaxID=3341728 RepID=UPI003A7F7E49